MKVYIGELTSYLNESFQISKRIILDVKAQPIELDVALAIPNGLIINEAVTNAIKYAFPNESSGLITIRFDSDMDHNILCTIADNGTGIPEKIFIDPPNSLGLNLIKGLTEQINGILEFRNDLGTWLLIKFTDNHSRINQTV